MLSNLVVILFLQNSVQIGNMTSFDLNSKASLELPNSRKSIKAYEGWLNKSTPQTRGAVSFCVVEPDAPDDSAFGRHLLKHLSARQDAGELDIYSSYKNVMAFNSASAPKSATFQNAANYCWSTVSRVKSEQQ